MCKRRWMITSNERSLNRRNQWIQQEKMFFLDIMCQPRKNERLSDYGHSITKSWEKKGNPRYNQVLQLRKQPNQMIPPLKVLLEEDETTAQFVEETGLTKAQL